MPTEDAFVVVPENIVVHLGAPDAPATNITVSFPEYIKNVASSEIYPTWPEEAIRANIYAQISYALNRVFTEWYRAQGYDFDITNDTRYDQSFVQGRDIFDNVSQIVDEIFNSYLVRSDAIEPLFAQYCNGTTTMCPGGLSQWGTVPLAEQGLSAQDILRTFYGDDIALVENAPVSPNLGGSWPGITYRLGDISEEIRTIQRRLNRISTNYPSIPKIYPVNGFFDESTENAVRAFQRQFNLTPDGLVGKATWYRIAFIYNNVKRLSELDSEGLKLEEVSREYPSALREGMQGVYVQTLQYLLAIVSAYYDEIPRLEARDIDGIFGPKTREAVEAYQKLVGLPVTGEIDPATWAALISTYQSVLRVRPLEEWLPGLPALIPPSGIFLVEGMQGEQVRTLQESINTIARVYDNIPSVTVDGDFGRSTRAAVEALQALFGLPQSGAVGPLTWAGISTLARDLTIGSQTPEGTYPGYQVGGEASS